MVIRSQQISLSWYIITMWYWNSNKFPVWQRREITVACVPKNEGAKCVALYGVARTDVG